MGYTVLVDLKVAWKEPNNFETNKLAIERDLGGFFVTVTPDSAWFTYEARGDIESVSKEIIKELGNNDTVDKELWKKWIKNEDFYLNFYDVEQPFHSMGFEEALDSFENKTNQSNTKSQIRGQ